MGSDSSIPGHSSVDAHCHIDLLKDPVAEVASAENRKRFTIAVTNAPSVFFHTRDLCRGKSFVYAALGLHPELIASHAHELPRFREHITESIFVGEIGLDYVTIDEALRRRQRDVFYEIVRCAAEHGGRVLSIHSRRSAGDVLNLLGSGTKNSAIIHWFSGTRKELERGIDAGCFFSANAAMLGSKRGRTILSAIPRERVLTETDAPFARVSGRPSTPDDIDAAISMLADAWRTTIEEARAAVESNFRSLLRTHALMA